MQEFDCEKVKLGMPMKILFNFGFLVGWAEPIKTCCKLSISALHYKKVEVEQHACMVK